MMINTAAGWRSLTGRPAPEVRQAATVRELSARMADELAELCPSMGPIAASLAAHGLTMLLSDRFAP